MKQNMHILNRQPKTRCVACLESITKGASVCPYCRSPQQISKKAKYLSLLKKIGILFKWAAAVGTVVTLLLGLIEINKVFESSRERRQAVVELVDAASMRKDEKEFSSAWDLLNEALALEPSSKLARENQVDLAMT